MLIVKVILPAEITDMERYVVCTTKDGLSFGRVAITSKLRKRMKSNTEQLFYATVTDQGLVSLGDYAPYNAWGIQ